MTRIPLLIALTLVCLAIGCTTGPTEPEDFEFGRLDVYVRDTAGEPINGVVLRLERRNGEFEESGLTGAVGMPGYFFFLKTASNAYRVTVRVPPGYELGPNQSSSVDVTFVNEQTQTVNFVLRRI